MKVQARISDKSDVSFLDFPTKTKSCITYFMYGCDFACEGCQNVSLKDPNTNDPTSQMYTNPYEVLSILNRNDIRRNRENRYVVLQGGDPFARCNRAFTCALLVENQKHKIGLEFCIYTGYGYDTVKQIISNTINQLGLSIDNPKDSDDSMDIIGSSLRFIKCGNFDKSKFQQSSKKNDVLTLASTNQEMYEYNFDSHTYVKISTNGTLELRK